MGTFRSGVDAEAVNRWLFQCRYRDKVLEHLMTQGQKVAAPVTGLGKTILFARITIMPEFIAKRFDANYPHYAGQFARVIDFKVDYAQSLIDSFSVLDKAPHFAISVDMLDTGIDVPEVVNLVFSSSSSGPRQSFGRWVGLRGTRLCPDLFGPGNDKKNFYIFDVCGNLEFFSQPVPPAVGGSLPD